MLAAGLSVKLYPKQELLRGLGVGRLRQSAGLTCTLDMDAASRKDLRSV